MENILSNARMLGKIFDYSCNGVEAWVEALRFNNDKSSDKLEFASVIILDFDAKNMP